LTLYNPCTVVFPSLIGRLWTHIGI